MRKRIYRFEPGKAEGRAEWKALLGGKGANLAEMANMGIPVPPGFTLSTEVCVDYLASGKVPDHLMSEVFEAMRWLEGVTGKTFGGGEDPLLVSVRSGGRSSMPGMMDTILDLGLNSQSLAALTTRTRSPRFALDAYRRLLAMFGNVVLGVPHDAFEHALQRARLRYAEEKRLPPPASPEALARVVPDSVLEASHLELVTRDFERIIAEHHGRPFPSDPKAQLEAAIIAVFESWNNPRAQFYRKMHGLPDSWGTAVNVQAMVFGNLGETSATGVAFTRDPSTGQRRFFGEWLPNAQGEDVVAGIRTPRPLARGEGPEISLEEALPDNYRELVKIQDRLEKHFRDMQDLEFTIEAGKLYLLQTRSGKRSARASVRIAVEMVEEGLLSPDEAILRIDPARLDELLFPAIDPQARAEPIARGIAASPGAVSGQVVFHADEAMARAERGDAVILVRLETSPEDLHGMKAARGILTARGGATSHAAVVARGMGRPCVTGSTQISVKYDEGLFDAHGPDGSIVATVRDGDTITIDGSTGAVYLGVVPTVPAELGREMQKLLTWTDRARRLQVRANADTPAQAEKALSFGAEGIGLCRTEHMFFEASRIRAMREMILAKNTPGRRRALDKLLPFQVQDFTEMFRIMSGKPVNIRLLDPPLHEFLPQEEDQLAELAKIMDISVDDVRRRANDLHEQNPMLGHRGVRLAITYPEIAEMQVRAILLAAVAVQREGRAVHPEIMIPLALSERELTKMRELVERVAAQVFAETKTRLAYEFGTMIELPRAALLADELAREAQFFSFGTNDLTQTTLGLSRDDAGTFLHSYVAQELLPADPFVTLDREGVGQLIAMAVEKGRSSRPGLSCGICGEHGGDPQSIDFCEKVGLSYVSCSPFRLPIARVAAAQAALRRGHQAGL